MLRALLGLLVLAAVVAALVSLWRRAASARRGVSVRELVEAKPAALPAPEEEPAPSPPEGALTSSEVFLKLHALAFGITPVDPPASPAHAEIAAAAKAALKDAATEPRYTPRRPLLLPQLLRAVNEDDVSRRDLAALIVRDPALTGNLLKLANAPFYRTSAQPVESIDRAIAVMGTEGIRSLIATAIMQPVFRVTGGEFARFPEVMWDHTFRSGTAAAAHAAMIENDDPFAAQLLALVTGLATIIVFRVALDQYALHPVLRPDVVIVAQLIDAHTAATARAIAASWELSERMLAALEDQIPIGRPRKRTPLGRSLRFGRLAGALALLQTSGDIAPDVAKATMLAGADGAANAPIEGIWTRLISRPVKS